MSKADLNNLGQLKTKEFITTNMNSFGIEYLQSSGSRVQAKTIPRTLSSECCYIHKKLPLRGGLFASLNRHDEIQ